MPRDDFTALFSRQHPQLFGQRILVALSGGPDSVALLHLLRHPDLELDLHAAHVHHAVRGEEADADAAFCEQLCGELQIPFHLVHLDPASSPGEGREAAWRRARYRALLAIKSEQDLVAVATGHHRDDVAEGVLMQLLRGAGPRAMAGIAAETADCVVRPLLEWTRKEILGWLEANGLEWREDSSNLDVGHLRNRVRHHVLPDLREVSPRIDDHLVALAQVLAEDEAHFARELLAVELWIDPWAADGGVPVADIRHLAPPVRARWLHAQAARVGISRVSRRQLELTNRLMETGAPRAVTLGGRWRLRLARGRLWLEPPDPAEPYAFELEPGTPIRLPRLGWQVTVTPGALPDTRACWHALMSSDAKLAVRSVKNGDRVHGPEGASKVSKLLSQHVPRHLRHDWPVFCENDTIVWIPGIWKGSVTGNLLVEVTAHG